MWHPAYFDVPLGSRWRDKLTKGLALYVQENRRPSAFTIWLYAQSDPKGWRYIYLTFPEPADAETWLLDMARRYTASGTESNGALPGAAVPVLKHERTGNLLRLWPPPGPDIPEVQRVKVEWATIRLTNRYYVMEQNGMQSE
jgi:hypothetical protein